MTKIKQITATAEIDMTEGSGSSDTYLFVLTDDGRIFWARAFEPEVKWKEIKIPFSRQDANDTDLNNKGEAK